MPKARSWTGEISTTLSRKAIRHLSIKRAKGLYAVGVIVVGAAPFATNTETDDQFAYFMGASRAKQLLAVV